MLTRTGNARVQDTCSPPANSQLISQVVRHCQASQPVVSAQAVFFFLQSPPSHRSFLLTYAHVCSRMLTYAHVCSRMVTYGDVCRQWRRWLPPAVSTLLTRAKVCMCPHTPIYVSSCSHTSMCTYTYTGVRSIHLVYIYRSKVYTCVCPDTRIHVAPLAPS
jgi:hypothetical protein